jgi:hypothetical protein
MAFAEMTIDEMSRRHDYLDDGVRLDAIDPETFFVDFAGSPKKFELPEVIKISFLRRRR